MQASLTNWIKSDFSNKMAHIFYLDWDNKTAHWLNESPSTKFKKEVTWKEYKIPVTICTNCDSYLDVYKSSNKNIPFLKSHLQKCIRRGLTNKAIKTANNMIQLNILEFIRRLSIIILEDCVLHDSLNILSWMIAAYPEWKPSDTHIEWLLGLVEYLSNLGVRDTIKYEEFDFKKNLKTINSLNLNHKTILYTINFRISYGGLNCDMKMLEYFSNLWLDRFQTDSEFNTYIETPIKPNKSKLQLIDIREIEPSAIDFHCFPQLLTKLEDKYPELNGEDIKHSIWYHRSRKNTKLIINDIDNYDNKYKCLWNTIKYDLNCYVLTILNKIKLKEY